MADTRGVQVAIVDYGLGNLFSVKHACERAGLNAVITGRKQEILAASAIILPGVGAFGDAMQTLARLDLVDCLREVAASGKILIGICLGMQLLMAESHEFGRHEGLGLIAGDVVRLPNAGESGEYVKVPQVEWNKIFATGQAGTNATWKGTLLDGLADGEYMYFVHSFYCRPADSGVTLATTRYGQTEFCSVLRVGNVFACQFHPERSSFHGIRFYRNLGTLINKSMVEEHGAQQTGSQVRIA